MSFNPQDLITQLYKGAAKPTCDDHSGTAFHEASLTDCYKYDVAGAKQLLDSAGWAMGSDGYRHKGGKTLELRYSTTNKASRKATQLLAQDPWKSVSTKIHLKHSPSNVFFGPNAHRTFHH